MSYRDPTIQFFGKLKLGEAKPAKVPRFCDVDAPKPAKANAQKRDRMQKLLNKENDREKKERVVSVLMNKLVSKFGIKYAQLINFFVEEFLSVHDEITPQELNKLEREINTAILSSVESSKEQKEAEVDKKSSAPSSRKGSGTAPIEPPPGSEWQVIQAYRSLKAEEMENKKQQAAREKREAIKKDLDQQMSYAKNRGASSKGAELEYAAKVAQDVEKYHEEEIRKREELVKKGERITAIRNQQIADNARRRQAEKDELDRMEKRNVELAKQSLEQENAKLLAQKRKSQEMQKRILLDNERKLQQDDARKLQEAEEEKKRMKEYAEKLERDQAKKNTALESKMKAMAAFGAKYESEGAGKAQREQLLKEEQFLLNEQRKKAAADEERERKKIEDRRIASQLALKENNRQMAEKRKKAEEEKRKEMEISMKYKEDAAAQKLADAETARKLKAKQDAYRGTLDAQLTERAGYDTNLTGLSEIERQINLSTIHEALADPTVANKVLSKVKGGTAPASNKK